MTLVMGFAKDESRRGGVGHNARCYLSVMCAGSCEGNGGAARGPVDCGASMRRLVVGKQPGRRGSAPCGRCARIWFPVASSCLVEYFQGCVGRLEFAGNGARGVGVT